MRPTKYNKGKKPPAFISNLHRLLSDSANHQFIKWRQDQESFIILNIPKFSEVVLPRYFKHSNYSSFVRQLNMYNFNKMRSELEGEHIFKNELFVKDSQENLRNIRRREVVTSKNSNILSIAQAISEQVYGKNSQQEPISNMVDSINEGNQVMELAAPSIDHSFFAEFSFLQNLSLHQSAQDYLKQMEKIPPTIPLKPQIKYFPLKTRVQQMKKSQHQLQDVCVGLYKQNQFLASENKRLQEKLRTEYKKKQQILNQIIKYVINFLSEWNSSTEVDEEKDYHKENIISDEDSSSDVVMDSYEMMEKRKAQNRGSNLKENKSSQQKGLRFSKYAQNQKKILLTLLQQIEKSYAENFFFTKGYSSNYPYEEQSPSQFTHFQQTYSTTSSPNSFMMSMLLKFIQSNNLVEVIKRFSLLINLERNKKSKNFTVVNCMNDLKEHFNIKELQKFEKDQFFNKQLPKATKFQIQPEGFEYLVAKEKYLENQKQMINQMEKELALITNAKKPNKSKLQQHSPFYSEENDSSLLISIPENLIIPKSHSKKHFMESQSLKQCQEKAIFQQKLKEDFDQFSDFEKLHESLFLEKFNFRLQ